MKNHLVATTSVLSLLLPSSSEGFAFPSSHRLVSANKKKKNAAMLLPPQFASVADDDIIVTTTPATTTPATKSPFHSFDWKSQWYPVSWVQDVPLNAPIRVTLFDVNYVLARTTASSTSSTNGQGCEEEDVFFAMLDSCPHKKVALSEGRITNCGTEDRRYIQCSYHGWTFDGETGECMEIPQTMIAKQSKSNAPSAKDDSPQTTPRTKKRREDATSVAVRVVQGMVWMQPFYTPLEALAAMEEGTLPPPPRIPEIDMEGYRVTSVVRDFPIDWTVLMENIMDPDHGYFAHSSSGAAVGFDWYSADGVENTMHVDEDFNEGGWKIASSVNAVPKLIKYNQNFRNNEGKPTTKKKEDTTPPRVATTTYTAPSLIALGRRTNSTSPSPFVTAFWVSPTGTGKSRFMSAAVGKTPFSIPRWMVHINLNNFLDQDTFLLCGQHRAVLKREAEGYLQGEDTAADGTNHVRKSTYVYRSPSERLPVRIGQFFDSTLARVPNRKEGVLAWYEKHTKNHKLLEPWPSREEVLNRYEQHTKICPDSMDLVERCDKVINSSKLVGMALIFMKVIGRSHEGLAQITAALSNPFVSGFTFGAVRQLFSQSTSIFGSLVHRFATALIQSKPFYSILALALLSHYVASRIKREFFFKFDDELHRKDIKYIAKNWVDL